MNYFVYLINCHQIKCYDWDSDGSSDYIGEFSTTVRSFLEASSTSVNMICFLITSTSGVFNLLAIGGRISLTSTKHGWNLAWNVKKKRKIYYLYKRFALIQDRKCAHFFLNGLFTAEFFLKQMCTAAG